MNAANVVVTVLMKELVTVQEMFWIVMMIVVAVPKKMNVVLVILTAPMTVYRIVLEHGAAALN